MAERICSVDGCGDPHQAHGLCNKHNYRMKKYGSTELPVKPRCRVEDCDGKTIGQGLCQVHYHRFIRYGTTDLVRKALPPEDRFWPKVDKNGPGGCWLWTASLDSKGYGQFNVSGPPNRRLMRAHRFAYLTLVGEHAPGLELDHLCRNRACVNPAHLEPVTHAENIRRGYAAKGVSPPSS